MLQRLGPTYVKIGQMMASRRDVLPAEWTDELSKLQSDAAPFAYEDVVAIVTKELGSPPEVLYADVRPDPVRRGVDGPGPPGAAPRRDARGGQGPATAHPGQDPGRPWRHPGACPCRRAADRGGPQDRALGDRGRVRPGRPEGARLSQRGVPRPPAGRRDAALPGDPRPPRLGRAVRPACHHHGVRQRDQDLEGGRAAGGRLRHRRSSAPSSSGRSSSRSSSTGSSTATRIPATSWPTRSPSRSSSSTSGWSGSSMPSSASISSA